MSNKLLKETKNYQLKVGTNPFDPGTAPQYIIVNKDTGIVEVETRVAPEAYGLLDQIQEALDRVLTRSNISEQASNVRPLIVN